MNIQRYFLFLSKIFMYTYLFKIKSSHDKHPIQILLVSGEPIA